MYNLLMALDDVLSDGQAHHTTHQYDIFTQPPGAATTDLPSSTHPRQADFLFEDLFPPGHLDAGLRHSTQMPSTFSIDNQSDGSETSVYTSSPADPTLSLPSSTHALKPRPSFIQYTHSPTPQSTPDTRVDLLSQSFPSSHSRALFQPRLTQTTLGGGCGHADAGPYAGAPELILKPPSEPAQPRLSPVSLNTSFLSPPPFPQQAPELAPWIFTTGSGKAGASHAENARNPNLIPRALENEPTPVAAYSLFSGHPGTSPAASSALFSTAEFTDMIPELPSHARDDPSAFQDPSPMSGMQVDLATATPFAGPASSGAHSRLAHRAPAQQATPPTSPEEQPEEQRATGKRRRLSEPKDARAAKRLRSQRQVDEENLDALYKLLVPSSAGVVQKKDRLGIILYHARKWMQTHSTTLGHMRDRQSTSSLPRNGLIESP